MSLVAINISLIGKKIDIKYSLEKGLMCTQLSNKLSPKPMKYRKILESS